MTVIGNEPEGISAWDKPTGRDDPLPGLPQAKMETREGVYHQKAKHLANWARENRQLIYNRFAISYFSRNILS